MYTNTPYLLGEHPFNKHLIFYLLTIIFGRKWGIRKVVTVCLVLWNYVMYDCTHLCCNC